MGMAIDGEGRAATNSIAVSTPPVVAPPPASPSPPPSHDACTTSLDGACETSEQKAQRERSNSEETALILTSMMSMSNAKGTAAATATNKKHHDSDDDGQSDMGDDFSGDDHDDDDDMDSQSPHSTSTSGGSKPKRRVEHVHVHFGGPTGSKLDFTDDAGFNHRFRNESNRVKSLVTKHISIDELREHFDRPIIDVAKDFGICITLMKKICRRNGIKRWPHRQIRSLSKSIASMEAAMLSSQGPERDKYRDQILSLKLKRDSVIADPNKENAMTRPKTPTKDFSTRPHTHVHAAPKLSPRSASPASTSAAQAGKENSKGGRWTSEEHAAFLHGIRLYGKDWRRVAHVVRTRSAVQTRTHAQKYLLKFAGRFPFDTDGVDLKQEPEASANGLQQALTEPADSGSGSGRQGVDEAMALAPASSKPNEQEKEKETETDDRDAALMSSPSLDDSVVLSAPAPVPVPVQALTVDTTPVTSSALETMAMILNSPQFNGSFRHMAPPAIQTQLHPVSGEAPSAYSMDDDVAMESPRTGSSGGVPATLPLLPSFVIKPGAWPAQPPLAETPTSTSEVDASRAAP